VAVLAVMAGLFVAAVVFSDRNSSDVGLGDQTFDAGIAEKQAESIAEDGPIILPDVSGRNERPCLWVASPIGAARQDGQRTMRPSSSPATSLGRDQCGARRDAPPIESAPQPRFRDRNRHLRSIPAVERRFRVVVAKPGLDGHDRGIKVIARALRDAGFEVIYTGLFQTPEQVAEAVLQEDADAVGLSVLSGAHMTLFPRVIDQLKARGLTDVIVFGGGIVPEADIAALADMGVARIFTPGAAMASVTDWLAEALTTREVQST